MTYKIRHRMFIVAVVTFIILTTILSLYATGYRLDWRSSSNWRQWLVKTGSLFLESNPKGAQINITSASGNYHEVDLKPDSGSVTPLKINNLMPGEYLLTLTLDDYWPYQKKFYITPEQTTHLDQINLFRRSLPMKVVSVSDSSLLSYRDDGQYAALLEEGVILNLREERTIAKIAPSSKVTWPETAKQAVSGVAIVNLDKGLVSDYTALTGPATSGALAGEKLFYTQDGQLLNFDTNTNRSIAVTTIGSTTDYLIQNNILIVATGGDQDVKIQFFDVKSLSLIKEISLLATNNLRLEKFGSYTVLTDYSHKLSYLINPPEQTVRHLLRETTLVRWLDGNRFAYTIGSEIRIYDTAQENDYLVARLSEDISDLVLGPNNHLIYATNSQLGTINLGSNDKDFTELFKGDKITKLKFDNNTATLYFFTTIGSSSGLYKINLQ